MDICSIILQPNQHLDQVEVTNTQVEVDRVKEQAIEVMKPVNNGLAELGLKGVYFEDNYTAHKTKKVTDYWASELKQFEQGPLYFPPNLTTSLQPIDAGIGLLYKNKVYEVIRNEIYRRQRDAMKNITRIQKLSAKHKWIMVTKAVGMVHREMIKMCLDMEATCKDMMGFPFFRSFVKTGTYVPVAHLTSTPTPPSYQSMSNLVFVQHFEHIKYENFVNRGELVLWQQEQQRKDSIEKHNKVVAEQKLAAIENEYASKAKSFFVKAEKNFDLESVQQKLIEDATPVLLSLAKRLHVPLTVMGSWPAYKLTKQVGSDELQAKIKADDIDVYIKATGSPNEEDRETLIDFRNLSYEQWDEFDREVNVVPVWEYSPPELLENNDINATALGIKVYLSDVIQENPSEEVTSYDLVTTAMIGTHFWQFLLASDNMLLPVHPTTANGKTLIRLAFKSYSMDIPCSWQHVDLDPEEILFKSHKKKWDTVRNSSTLLDEYVLRTLPANKKRKKAVYKLSKATIPAVCVECKKRANAKCVRKCCFLCCKKFSSTVEEFMECTVHKHVHKKRKRDEEEGEYQEET